MRCAWEELLKILPGWMQGDVDHLGRESLQELRLRQGYPPELICANKEATLRRPVSGEDLKRIVHVASAYSPWAASTIGQGYVTAPGGHRIGICGEVVASDAGMTGIRVVTSLCVRVARDLPGIAQGLDGVGGSVLIIGRPGSGKTTLLRDLIRLRSRKQSMAVVDEREELFPLGYDTGPRTDILRGCPKVQGVDILLRTMGPGAIAVDEITAAADCEALLRACWCGVDLLATAHAGSREDLYHRPVYEPLLKSGVFKTLVILRSDKTWHMERMTR